MSSAEAQVHESVALEQERAADLIRGLGPWQATAVVVSTIIGTGVFLVAAPMARAAGSAGLVLAAWLIGTVIALSGMLCFAELGAALPDAGGLFAYLTRGLGPVWGFLFGWTESLLGSPVGFATLAAGFMAFVGFLRPGLDVAQLSWHWGGHVFTVAATRPMAATLIVALTAVNCLQVWVGGGIQLLMGSLKVAAILIIIAAGALVAGPPVAAVASVLRPAPGGGVLAVLGALVPVMWAYNGFQMLGNLGAEIREPGKNIPRALVCGVLVVSVLYVLVNITYFHVLSFNRVARSSAVASEVVQSILGARGAGWLTLAMCVSALASLHGVIMQGARVPYAMAHRGLFFGFTGRVHPRFHSPMGALLFQGTLGALVVLTGSFEQLFSLYVFVMWIFAGLGALALIRLRVSAPDLPRPYRAFGYPLTPLLFAVASLALTASLLWERPVRSSIGLAVILAGLPFYRFWRRRSRGASPLAVGA
jgi:basic amino acid/polyamine antiporter, APA family